MTPAAPERTEKPTVPATTPSPSGLRERAARQRQRQNRLGIALVAVLAIGALAVYVPQRRAIASMRLELLRTEAELAANQGKADMLPQLKLTVAALRRQVDQYKPLRGGSDIQQALHEISTINNSTQLAGYKYETGEIKSRPLCREQPLKITFQAEFVDAMSFIQKLEAMDRLTRVRELSIQKYDAAPTTSGGKPKTGEVEVTMSLSIYFDPSLEAQP